MATFAGSGSACDAEGGEMSLLSDKRGVSLVMVLVLGAISAALVVTLYLMVGTGARVSGSIIRYTSALEAAKSQAFLTQKLIEGYLNQTLRDDLSSLNDTKVEFPNPSCIKAKLERETLSWSDSSYSERCPSLEEATSANSPGEVKGHADIVIDVGEYKAYAKIVDTKLIPTSKRAGVALTGVAYSKEMATEWERVYTVHVLAEEKALFNKERAWVSFVYSVGPAE